MPSWMRTPGVTDMAYPDRSPEDQSGLTSKHTKSMSAAPAVESAGPVENALRLPQALGKPFGFPTATHSPYDEPLYFVCQKEARPA